MLRNSGSSPSVRFKMVWLTSWPSELYWGGLRPLARPKRTVAALPSFSVGQGLVAST